MPDTATKVRYFRAYDTGDNPVREYGDTRCESHTLAGINTALMIAGFPIREIEDVDLGMQFMNLVSKVNGHSGLAMSEEHDVRFQRCSVCRHEADQQKAAS